LIKIAAIVLTLNEEIRIKECLEHIQPYVEYILVLDGCSTDKTVEIALKYADRVHTNLSSDDFAEERNFARTLIPKGFNWLLWVDADEKFDIYFLRDIKMYINDNPFTVFRFPRCNLPDGKDFPDYQIRLFPNSRDIEWRGKTHETLYYVPENKPLDKMDNSERRKIIPIETLDQCPIIHLPRRTNEKRPWW